MVLLVGSTGRLGGEICRALALKGIPIRALARVTASRQAVERLKNYGSAIAWGDLRETRSLEEACRGVHQVICSATALSSYLHGENDFETVDRQGVIRLIDCAAEAGADHFIYLSLFPPGEAEPASPLRDAQQAIENHLAFSGMMHTIVRPGFLMERWFSPEMGFDLAARRVVIFGDGSQPVDWVSIRDAARAAVVALAQPALRPAVIDLRGPYPVSQLEAIQALEDRLGCSLEKVFWPQEYLSAKHRAASEPLEKTRFSLFLACAAGQPGGPAIPGSQRLYGAVTMEAFLRALPAPEPSGAALPVHPQAWGVLKSQP